MSLMEQIRAHAVPRRAVAMWWLGQNGYIFKSHAGTLVAVDLYLSNTCGDIYAGSEVNLERAVPVLIQPEEVNVDVFACTHNHLDHTDPETIARLGHKDTTWFVGPHPTCAVFRDKGIDATRIHPAWPDCEIPFGDVTLYGAFALPTDVTDLNHLGFVLQFDKELKVYVTGDTDYSDLLLSVARHSPQVMITCINGGFNNLSHYEAAMLAARLKPRVAIPCHYDMFPDNSMDPKQFRAALALRAPEVRYQCLEHGVPFVFSL